MGVMLTIDWDYFVPEDLSMDLEHKENDFFISTLWGIRAVSSDIMDKITTSGEEIDFWDKLREKVNLDNAKLFVTESHAFAFDLAYSYDVRKVINFDSHCDLYYTDYETFLNNICTECENWCGNLLRDKFIDKATVVLSTHSHEIGSVYDKLNVEITDFNSFQGGDKIDVLHICRSGAWTPPWLDSNFYAFVMQSGIPPTYLRLTPREFDKENVIRARNEFDEIRRMDEFD